MSLDEPNMSDRTLLVSVEDLINMAMGPEHKNVVNFKIIQTVLHILARQQRMLQQLVEVRITEIRQESPPPASRTHRKAKKVKESLSWKGSSPSSSPRTSLPKKRVDSAEEEKPKDTTTSDKQKAEKEKAKAEKEIAKAEKEKAKAEKEKAKAEKEKAKAEKEKAKAEKEKVKAEKEVKKRPEKDRVWFEKEQEKTDRSAKKEQERVEKAELKEQETAQKEKDRAERLTGKEEDRATEKEQEKADRSAEKEKEKADRVTEKEREKADRAVHKEKEKADRAAEKEKEKADRAAQKEREKSRREAEKEREKSERESEKEREKAEKEAEKEREKAVKEAEREREKAEKVAEKERERADRATEKEREKADRDAQKVKKAERKEQEPAEKEAAKSQKEKERAERNRSQSPAKQIKKPKLERVSSISISEVERGKEKVLVESRGRTGGIDVVTQSQFALLEAAVKGLMEKTAPMGELRMPDNKRLKNALAKGSASLTDTMQAMQVNARVKAAEEAIDRMAGLLTQLAAAGAVPDELADQVAEAKREAERTLSTSDTDDGAPLLARPLSARKSVAIDPKAILSVSARPSVARAVSAPTPRGSISTVLGRASDMSQASSTVSALQEPKVTRGEMEDIIKSVKDDLWKYMNSMTTKATASAEIAMHTTKAIADKLDVALQLDNRISNLHSLVTDYADQLSGFDVGLTTQMKSFQEQMSQIRGDLTGGLQLLESVNNNAETAAVLELTERYEELATELEHTVSAHRALADFQAQLGEELRRLAECVEMLREEKADRDEVIDGLRDKADTSRLAGLLTEAEFASARAELQRRLDVCHDKFRRQDLVWMGAIKDLLKTTDLKAEIVDVMSMRDGTQWQLRALHDELRLLAAALGEPQAALLTRQLARGAACGACGVPALMGLKDPGTGVPPALPALRPPPPAEEPCLADLKDWMPPEPADDRHVCLRWCGGSHTLLSERTTREEAPPLVLTTVPTRKFTDYGRDGRLYMMEEELQPCRECNELLDKERGLDQAERLPPVGEEGAGDQGPTKTTIP